jgi:glycine/D-amino acid oxidase-like deaminating enzyme
MHTAPRYLRPCGWNALLPPRTPAPPLSGDVDADLAVVGAGYTGLAAARAWAEGRPDDRVVLLDASTAGEGSPGRNSGFLLEIALAADADAGAVQRMTRCNTLIHGTLARLRELVQGHGVDCGLSRRGTYRGAATPSGLAALGRYRRFLDAAGLPYEALDADALAARIGTHHYRFGLWSPHCWLAQPAALVRGLADALPPSVSLHEESPVLSVREAGRGLWHLRTPAARVRAPRVILANNAFAARLGVARSRLAVMYTYAGLTETLSAQRLAGLGSDSDWGLLPAHRMGTTLRRTADGRLLVRSHYGYEREEDNARVAARLQAALARRFPALARGASTPALEHVWGGATGFTYNAAPVWGEWRAGLWVSAGCNGGGVVKGTLFGDLIARRALGEQVPDVHTLFGRAAWMPAEPFRRAGFALCAAIERRQAGAEA